MSSVLTANMGGFAIYIYIYILGRTDCENCPSAA